MHEPLSPNPGRDGRALRRPMLLTGIALLIVAMMVAAFFLARHQGTEPTPGPAGGAAAGGQRSGYQNRGLWPSAATAGHVAKVLKVTGKIYDTEGRAVAGAAVTATTFQVAGNQSTVAGSITSNEQGQFELPLRDGTYYLTCEKEGFGPTMAFAHAGEDIGLVLKPSGVVSGHVYDEQKRPVRHFSIDVLGLSTDDMAAPAPFVSKQFDSPDGSFRIAQLPDRGVSLRATAPDRAPALSETIAVAAGESKEVDLTLSSGCTLLGVVEDEEGGPLANVFVDAELRRNAGAIGVASFDAASEAESDDNGHFKLEHVPVGDVLVRGYDGAHAVTTIEGTVASCDKVEPVRLRMSAGGELAGMVVAGDGRPVAGAKLTLMHRSIGFVNTLSDADGHYHFGKLPTGGMRLEAQRGAERAVVLVNIAEGEVTTRDVPFPPAGTGEIQGVVTASGQPLQGMQLLIAASTGDGLLNMVYPVTDKDGSYRATGLPPGSYAVLVSSSSKMASAHVEDGKVEKVNLDMGAARAAPEVPEIPPPGAPRRNLDEDRNE